MASQRAYCLESNKQNTLTRVTHRRWFGSHPHTHIINVVQCPNNRQLLCKKQELFVFCFFSFETLHITNTLVVK